MLAYASMTSGGFAPAENTNKNGGILSDAAVFSRAKR